MQLKILTSLGLSALITLSACSPVLLKPGANNDILSDSVLKKDQEKIVTQIYPSSTEMAAQPGATPTPSPALISTFTSVPTYEEPITTATPLTTEETVEASPLSPTALTMTTPTAHRQEPTATASAAAPAALDVAKELPTDTTSTPLPLKLMEGLSRRLRVSQQDLVILDLQPVVWPDLCFDFRRENAPSCNQLPTPGYRGSVAVNRPANDGNPQYEFRSNEKGDLLYLMPTAALAASQVLADQLGILVGEIYFNLVEPWDWPNACAMTPTPLTANELCIQVRQPGWRVILGANQKHYEFHTDANGQVIQAIQAP